MKIEKKVLPETLRVPGQACRTDFAQGDAVAGRFPGGGGEGGCIDGNSGVMRLGFGWKQ